MGGPGREQSVGEHVHHPTRAQRVHDPWPRHLSRQIDQQRTNAGEADLDVDVPVLRTDQALETLARGR